MNKKLQLRTKPQDGLSFRESRVDGSMGEDAKTPKVRMTISSDTPCLTYINFKDQYMMAYEILDHSESSVDRSRMLDGLIIQDTHHGDQIGLIRNVEIKDGKMGGEVEFCSGERAQEIAQDAANGLRKNSSVGYMVDPSSYRLEGDKDGYPLVRAMRWTPYEGSFVNVPADTRVGVGRELNKPLPVGSTKEKEKNMNPKQYGELLARALEFGVAERLGAIVEANPEFADAQRVLNDVIINAQRDEIKASKVQKTDPLAGRAAPAPVLGGDEKTEKQIVRQFSVLKVMRRAAGISSYGSQNTKVDCGFEDEVNQECRRLGLGSVRGGQFIIPHAVLASRTLSVSGTSSATVGTQLLANEFIDVLRPKTILAALGVQFRTGWQGNVDIPKMSAGATGYWVAEGVDVTSSEQTLGQVSGTPHTAGFCVDVTRRMLMQSTPDAEMIVRDDITRGMGVTVQTAYFQGTGADGQPSAITAATGINNPSVTAGTPTYLELLGFPGSIMVDNASADGQKWAISGKVWQKLAGTFTDGTAKAERVLDFNSKTCLGFGYEVSESVGTNAAFFGDFSSTMVGIWGAGVDINLDTASLSKSGGLRVVALQDVDIMARIGQALAYSTAVTN